MSQNDLVLSHSAAGVGIDGDESEFRVSFSAPTSAPDHVGKVEENQLVLVAGERGRRRRGVEGRRGEEEKGKKSKGKKKREEKKK